MQKPCEYCGKLFYFKPSHINRARFCSRTCLGAATVKQKIHDTRPRWSPNVKPYTRTKKGERVSPETEFKKGQRPANVLKVGSVTIRTDKNDKERAFVKVSEPNIWKQRSTVVWETIHGPLPKGCIVHHRDRDTLNDAPENLEMMTRSQHILEHRLENNDARIAGLRASKQNPRSE